MIPLDLVIFLLLVKLVSFQCFSSSDDRNDFAFSLYFFLVMQLTSKNKSKLKNKVFTKVVYHLFLSVHLPRLCHFFTIVNLPAQLWQTYLRYLLVKQAKMSDSKSELDLLFRLCHLTWSWKVKEKKSEILVTKGQIY